MSERAIQAEVLIGLSERGGLWYRQNSAMAWAGSSVTHIRQPTTVRLMAGDVVIRNARPIRAGVPGCSDIVGCLQGRFVVPEIKTASGRQSDAQRNYQAAVERNGGLYLLGRSFDEILDGLKEAGL